MRHLNWFLCTLSDSLTTMATMVYLVSVVYTSYTGTTKFSRIHSTRKCIFKFSRLDTAVPVDRLLGTASTHCKFAAELARCYSTARRVRTLIVLRRRSYASAAARTASARQQLQPRGSVPQPMNGGHLGHYKKAAAQVSDRSVRRRRVLSNNSMRFAACPGR